MLAPASWRRFPWPSAYAQSLGAVHNGLGRRYKPATANASARQRPRSAPPRLAARRSRSRRPRRLDALRTAKGDSAPGRVIARRVELRSEQARIGRFSPHVLRRTSATQVLDQGADVATVADLMGHASLDTTRRYDRRGEQAKRDAMAAITVPYARKGAR